MNPEADWYEKRDTPARWSIIREIYRQNIGRIMEARDRGLRGRTDPYLLDWDFTPIERQAWQEIRGMALPLYPQFPVDRYFIDFADPKFKIGVELDGKAFHDPVADMVRDRRLLSLGWRMFRIPGRKSFPWKGVRPFSDEWYQLERRDAELALHDWAIGCSEGFFWSLSQIVYSNSLKSSECIDYRGIASASLHCHKGIEFDLPWLGGDE